MSKEEIRPTASELLTKLSHGEVLNRFYRFNVISAMKAYAKQETEPLNLRITQLESQLQMLQDYLIKEKL